MAILCAESPSSPHWSLLKLRSRQPESISVLEIKFLPLSVCISQDCGWKLKAHSAGILNIIWWRHYLQGCRQGFWNLKVSRHPRTSKNGSQGWRDKARKWCYGSPEGARAVKGHSYCQNPALKQKTKKKYPQTSFSPALWYLLIPPIGQTQQ